ncbi:hypothetical protein CRUP_021542 [Coryphaenoides rupestris]|nr:hypothetical protein CRUP_021542 [Coryphaenoides rupestris]
METLGFLVLCSVMLSHGVQGSGGSCGGSLSVSGSFSSPHYPGSYYNNAYCVWQLRASNENRIYLSVDDLHSPFLGTLCQGNTTLKYVQSSSTYMTVVFRTDSSVTDRGFHAEFTSSVPPSAGSGGSCGGSLSVSGSFSSPHYPDSYYNNAYCVWQLRASNEHRIYLSVDDLQCDYIAVYDGPSVHSPFLGTLCQGNTTSKYFQSSSTYMTVVFRTDSSVTDRGFHAEFTSSVPPSAGRVECSTDNMHIVMEKSYLNSLGYTGNDLYLNDPYCRPQISAYQVVFSFPLNTCGTVRTFNNGTIIYRNALRASASNHGVITRQSALKLNVDCHMEPDTTVQILYQANPIGNGTITGMGRFNATMAFYTSRSFQLQVTQVPYEVALNEDMYVQVNLRRDDSSLVLFLDTCVASPSPTTSTHAPMTSSAKGRVECSTDNMHIVMEKSYLNSLGYTGNDLYLNDPYCRPQISAYQVVFSFPLNTCGTVRTVRIQLLAPVVINTYFRRPTFKPPTGHPSGPQTAILCHSLFLPPPLLKQFNNGTIIYRNALRASASNHGVITRQSALKLNVDCHMEPDTTVQILYQANPIGNGTITGMGRFNATMAFYTSRSFQLQVTQVPYQVALNEDMYVQVNLRRDDSGLVLFLDTCVASPSPHDFHTHTYDIVRQGCPMDSTYQAISSGTTSRVRFTFKAFQFLRTHDSVYMQCTVVVCPASDPNSRCRRGCIRRKARSLRDSEDSQTLVLGPITLRDPQSQQGNGGAEEEAEPKKSIDV